VTEAPDGARSRLALVFAHPDDDAFTIGGTIALHAGDADVMAVLATSGEAGQIAKGSVATRRTLGTVREAEARAAYEVLGAGDARIEFLRHPDGRLARRDREALVRAVTELLTGFRPDVVITFGPEGVTKHADHVTMHHVGTEAFHRARVWDSGGAFRRLLYVAIPWSRIRRFQAIQQAAGREPMDPHAPFVPRGVDDDTIAVHVVTLPVADRVVAAIRAHRTQSGEILDVPESDLPEVFGQEHFVQAWPERPAGSPVLSDVLEGLEAGPGG